VAFLDLLNMRDRKLSYSQCGEDLIVDFVFSARPPSNKFFIDVGAHHPSYLNNTYLYYKRGWTGINIDPLSRHIALFDKRRPRDTNVCAGIGDETKQVVFYVMDPETLSTFDKATVDAYEQQGHKLLREEEVRFFSASDMIKTYELPSDVGLMSVDIEGNEDQVIRDFLDAGIRPNVIICETVYYSPKLPSAKKNKSMIEAISALGYRPYADTFVNTIFLCRDWWER
jgi:FkbM family methyltransferase